MSKLPQSAPGPNDAPAHAAKAVIAYAEWCGGVHDDDCPADDTCDCSGKWINDGVTAAVNLLRAQGRQPPSAPAPSEAPAQVASPLSEILRHVVALAASCRPASPPQAGMRATLAAKHARRLRQQIIRHGCPRLDEMCGPLWCPECMDREQIAGLLDQLPQRRSVSVEAPRHDAEPIVWVALNGQGQIIGAYATKEQAHENTNYVVGVKVRGGEPTAPAPEGGSQ